MAEETDLVKTAKLKTIFDNNLWRKNCKHQLSVYDPFSSQQMLYWGGWWQEQGEISRGSFGRVSRETGGIPSNGVRAVKKIIPRKGSTSLDYRRELNAVFEFSQGKYEPYFVKAHGWFMDEEKKLLCIAMEYVEHGNMKEYLGALNGESHPFDENEAGIIAAQLLEGLDFMHKAGYAHRDIKPSNIVFYSRPPEPRVKITDFGISKHIGEQSTESTARFTWGYQGPEVDGFEVKLITIKSGSTMTTSDAPRDIWAIGEICFQMLTNEPTFSNVKQRVDYFQRKKDAKVPVEKLNKSAAQDFIRQAMMVDPVDRITAERGLNHTWIKSFRDTLSAKKVFGVSLETSMGYAKSANRAFQAYDTDSFEIVVADSTLPIILAESGQYLTQLVHLGIFIFDFNGRDQWQAFHAQKSVDRIAKLRGLFDCSPRFGRSLDSADWSGCTVRDVLELHLDFIKSIPQPKIISSKLLLDFINSIHPDGVQFQFFKLFEDFISRNLLRCNHDVLVYCLYLMDYLWRHDVFTKDSLFGIMDLFGSALLDDNQKSKVTENQKPFSFLVLQTRKKWGHRSNPQELTTIPSYRAAPRGEPAN